MFSTHWCHFSPPKARHTLDTGALVNVFSNNVFIQVVFVKICKVYTL